MYFYSTSELMKSRPRKRDNDGTASGEIERTSSVCEYCSSLEEPVLFPIYCKWVVLNMKSGENEKLRMALWCYFVGNVLGQGSSRMEQASSWMTSLEGYLLLTGQGPKRFVAPASKWSLGNKTGGFVKAIEDCWV